MTDNGHMVVPEGEDVGVVWADLDPVGSPFMIGCVSNRFTAVCRYVVCLLVDFLRADHAPQFHFIELSRGPLFAFLAPATALVPSDRLPISRHTMAMATFCGPLPESARWLQPPPR
jgi:hypothetical protein